MSQIASLLGSPLGQGAISAAGPLLDTGINSFNETFVNRPTRMLTALGLGHYLGSRIDQTDKLPDQIAGNMTDIANNYRNDAMTTLDRQRANMPSVANDVNTRLRVLLGYDPGTGNSVGTMDPKNALGRYNVLGRDKDQALASIDQQRDLAFNQATDARSEQTADAAARGRLQVGQQESDLATQRSLGNLTAGQAATMRLQAQGQAGRTVGDQALSAQVAYEQNRQNIRASYTQLKETTRGLFTNALTQAGSDIGREAEFVSNLTSGALQFDASMRENFNAAERGIQDSYSNTLLQAENMRANLSQFAAQFAANGYTTIASAILGTQMNPQAYTGYSAAVQSFQSSFQQGRAQRAADRAQDQGGFFG